MTFSPSVCFAMLTVSVIAHAQTLSTFQVAYTENQIFRLRDAVEHSTAPLFYRAALEASSNRVQAAETDLHSIIHVAPHSTDAYEAHDLLANMYFRNGMFRQGRFEIVAALKERPDADEPLSMLPIATALSDLPQMTVSAIKPSQLRIDPGSTFLPLKVDDKDAEFFFDTGSGISVIGESEAQELRLTLRAVDGKMGDASGQGVTGLKIALATDLTIGGLHLKNIPFLVIDDKGEPWTNLPRKRRGILGIQVLLLMRTLRWTPAGSFAFGFPARNLDLATCNMLFHNSNPTIDVRVNSKHLDFTLDTGAGDTDLNPPFAKALPSLMESGTPENRFHRGPGRQNRW